MIIELSKDKINEMDLSSLISFFDFKPDFQKYIKEKCGEEHYKLLAYISQQLKVENKVSDVGTYYGASALALAFNPNVEVVTYDIVNCFPRDINIKTAIHKDNIRMKVMSGLDDIALISKSDIIMLDIDPHDGIAEEEFIKKLVDVDYKGVVICDDIKLNDGMRKFWDGVPVGIKKIDLTELGHWSGTGALVFDASNIDIIVSQ